MTILGPVRGTKAAAQQSAAQRALEALAERPELVPQDGPGAKMGEVVENAGKNEKNARKHGKIWGEYGRMGERCWK